MYTSRYVFTNMHHHICMTDQKPNDITILCIDIYIHTHIYIYTHIYVLISEKWGRPCGDRDDFWPLKLTWFQSDPSWVVQPRSNRKKFQMRTNECFRCEQTHASDAASLCGPHKAAKSDIAVTNIHILNILLNSRTNECFFFTELPWSIYAYNYIFAHTNMYLYVYIYIRM